MDNQARIEKMRQRLETALKPSRLEISDDSHLHAGHAGAKSGKGHFTVVIESPMFSGLTRLKQQQAVFAAVGDMMDTDIHALVIKASVSPE